MLSSSLFHKFGCCSCYMTCIPWNIPLLVRCFDAGDWFNGLSQNWISSFESYLAVLVAPVVASQYLMLCILFPTKIHRHMIMDSMLLVYYQVSLLLSLLQTLLGRLSSAGKNTYSNIILILLWYVQFYNHAACSSASAQNSVPNLAEYIIHISHSFLQCSEGSFFYFILWWRVCSCRVDFIAMWIA